MQILTLSFFMIVFSVSTHTDSTNKDFIKNLSAFCGNHYSGTVVFPEGDKDPFKGEALKIHFATCGESEVRIPFQVGSDKSRTWVITLDEKGLLLKHDHRHENGTPDDITMYGGYAKINGTAFSQSFPADEHTAALIPAAATNEWTLKLSDDKKTLSYMLSRHGELRFHAIFDLSKAVK